MNGREPGVIFITKQALPHPRQNPHLLRRRDVLRSRLHCWRNPGRLRLLGRLDDLLHSLEENAKPAVMLKVVECEYGIMGAPSTPTMPTLIQPCDSQEVSLWTCCS